MNQVLDLLSSDSLLNRQKAATLITPFNLNAASEPIKHKLKTKVSSMLKSQGKERATGAVIARLCLEDWSIIKSHGSVWGNIMLHALDLPDTISWKPCIRTLTALYVKVHGKADLSRDIAGQHIGDYMKRLTNLSSKIDCSDAITTMLELYPTQCRKYLNELAKVTKGETLAYMCFSERKQQEEWQKRFSKTLNEGDLDLLYDYLKVASLIDAFVPSESLFARIFEQLASLKPGESLRALNFISNSFHFIGPIYKAKFDALVFQIAECLDLGIDEASASVVVLDKLVRSVGCISQNYTSVFSLVTKKVLNLLSKRSIATGASGLADYVQNPEIFSQPAYSDTILKTFLQFLEAVCVHVPHIPQSLRVQIDKYVLELGDQSEVLQLTLYPGKFSILPLAINQNRLLKGLETLVHPRLPPPTLSYERHLSLEQEAQREVELEFQKQDEEAMIEDLEAVNETLDTKDDQESLNNIADQEKSMNNDSEIVLPTKKPIPIPKPDSFESSEFGSLTENTRQLELEIPPGKRLKVDEKVEDISSVIVQQEEKDNYAQLDEQEEDMDSDDDLIIPSLVMDSD